ncbi:RNA-directed DNA polymerase, eukaryota [Tanacetum coccineum]
MPASLINSLFPSLVDDGVISLFPSITAVCLDRHLSDHCPILLCEVKLDYGPIPFRLYHSWFGYVGFEDMVEQTWRSFSHSDRNVMIRFKKKLQELKKIIGLDKDKNSSYLVFQAIYIKELLSMIKRADQGGVFDSSLIRRHELKCQLNDIKAMEATYSLQKSKVRWAIEGDENSKYFHGIINKKRSYLAIRGVFDEGIWLTDPSLVKKAFIDHYGTRFKKPTMAKLKLKFSFPNRLSQEQTADLERGVSHDEIRSAVWDCGENKSLAYPLVERSMEWLFKGIVSSFHALNRALLLKWVWRFVSQDGSLWFRVIQAVYGSTIDTHSIQTASIWSSILREVQVLKANGFDFISQCSKRIGDGNNTRFWLDIWKGDKPFRDEFPRMFALESNQQIFVATKLAASLEVSLRRPVRGGLEQQQFSELYSIIHSVSLSSSFDRWVCSVSSDDDFSVKEVRNVIDELYLPSQSESTRWVKVVPIKINIFAWRARRDCLPTRSNLIRRGVSLESSSCPLCLTCEEDVHHVFFRCSLSRAVLQRVCRWWDLDWQDWSSFSEWYSWFSSIRLSSKVKSLLEGVFYVAWWSIWGLRNRTIFDATPPTRSVIFDDIVSHSFHWCYNRCKRLFSWDAWLKNPHLISL